MNRPNPGEQSTSARCWMILLQAKEEPRARFIVAENAVLDYSGSVG